MATQPEGFSCLEAVVVSVKGECGAGHRPGDVIRLGCWDAGGLCGFFYHDIFPTLTLFQFGGRYPWESSDEYEVGCPDKHNLVTIRLKRPAKNPS
jgi:uncharacterized repeat protein (TIGR04076 family)